MDGMTLVGFVIALAVGMYLVAALLKPEWFA